MFFKTVSEILLTSCSL